jgi:hypothetical protein
MAAEDEWQSRLPVRADGLAPGRSPDEFPADSGAAPDPFPREGPAPFDADSWDIDPNIKVSNDPYRGVRRHHAPRPSLRAGIVVGLLVLAAAVAVPVILFASGATEDPTSAAGRDPAATPGLSGEGTGADSSAPSPSVRAEIASTLGASAAPFAPLAVEAEKGPPDVKLRGSQVVAQAGASGGEVVRFTDASGEIQIRGVVIPAGGSYRITIYYVAAASDGSARVSVASTSIVVGFPSGSGCCPATAVDMVMSSGTRTLTISNSDGAPPIDRIVVSRP